MRARSFSPSFSRGWLKELKEECRIYSKQRRQLLPQRQNYFMSIFHGLQAWGSLEANLSLGFHNSLVNTFMIYAGFQQRFTRCQCVDCCTKFTRSPTGRTLQVAQFPSSIFTNTTDNTRKRTAPQQRRLFGGGDSTFPLHVRRLIEGACSGPAFIRVNTVTARYVQKDVIKIKRILYFWHFIGV